MRFKPGKGLTPQTVIKCKQSAHRLGRPSPMIPSDEVAYGRCSPFIALMVKEGEQM